jgi:enoyl-CoA hydratase/carnithine racemase
VPRLIGLPRALELMVTGRPFTGAEAAAIGLCTRALPPDQVLAATQDLAREVAEHTAPLAVAVTKRLLHAFVHEEERPDAMTRETKLIWWLGSRPDATEGPMARLERRAAEWTDDKRTPLPPP